MSKLIFLILIPNLIFVSCSKPSSNELEMNKRFNYESLELFKISMSNYGESLGIKYDLDKINKIKNYNNSKTYQFVIENDYYENFLSNNPYEIYSLIESAKRYQNKDEIIFKSTQVFLRFISLSNL
tara:strand:- start:144 stop:521 length:378 start_codon:yes stop_codon:yes gene_type:complete